MVKTAYKAAPLPLSLASPLYAREWRGVRRSDDVALLLHGALGHSEWFTGIGGELAEMGYDALAYDRPGWGQSPGPRGTMESLASTVTELGAVALHLRASYRGVHLVGEGWGALLALHAGSSLPRGTFASVALVAPTLFRRKGPSVSVRIMAAFAGFAGLEQRLPLELRPADVALKADVLTYMTRDKYRARFVTPEFFSATRALEKTARRLAAEDDLPPLTIWLAEKDGVADNDRTAAYASKRRVPLETVPGAAHALVLEDPVALATRFVAVWTELNARVRNVST